MIPCTLRQLEIFLAAAEDCHFARTANRLGISQPAITGHIKTLEDQLGHQLFVRRKGTRPLLSQEGAILLRQARTFLAEGNKINTFKAKRETQEPALVRICAGNHLLDTYIRPRLSAFHERHSNIFLEFQPVGSISQATQLIERGLADLFVFTVRDPAAVGLNSEVQRTVRICLYANREFLPRQQAGPEEISALPFILPLEGSPQDNLVQRVLREVGIVCTNIATRTQYTDVMVDMASHGLGIAALYECMVAKSPKRKKLISFDLQLPLMHRCIFRLDQAPTPPIQKVQEFLRTALSV